MAAMSNFWQRVVFGIIFLIIMMGSIIISFPSFLLVFGVVVILATREYIKITSMFASPNKALLYISNITSYFLVAAILFIDLDSLGQTSPFLKFIKHFITGRLFIFLCLFFPVLIMAAEMFRKGENQFYNMVFSVFGFTYIAVPFMLLIQTFSPVIGSYNFQGPLSFFLLLWVADTFAYCWGKMIGKHKLVPHISGGKTWEGTIGGIVSTMALSMVFPFLFPGLGHSTAEWIVYAGLIATFAVPSDLTESLLKRKAGLKDSGNTIPGHGGILDRFDSVLLTAPVIYIYTSIIQHL